MKHLYIIQSDVTGAIKIGISKNPQKRLKQLQTGSPYTLRIMLVLENKAHLEKYLHNKLKPYIYSKYTCKGEWFEFACSGELPEWIMELIDLDTFNTWWDKS